MRKEVLKGEKFSGGISTCCHVTRSIFESPNEWNASLLTKSTKISASESSESEIIHGNEMQASLPQSNHFYSRNHRHVLGLAIS